MTVLEIILTGVFATASISLAVTTYKHGRKKGYKKGKRRGAYESKHHYDVVVNDQNGMLVGESTARPGQPAVVKEGYGLSVVVLPGYEDGGDTEVATPDSVGEDTTDRTQLCRSEGPGGIECTRHAGHDGKHVTYPEVNGNLQSVEFFDCNPLGEPLEGGDEGSDPDA